MSLTVSLPKFEGPLDLLLYLIRKEEMSIMDIKIHEITQQYFEFIKVMKELDLEMAGEFVAMAATLLQIKSRMLLPQYNDQGEIITDQDPRKELVHRLLEYQKFQDAARQLYERPLLGRELWARGIEDTSFVAEQQDEEILLEESGLFSLITAYRKALRSMKKTVHQVMAKLQSIASRILEIKDLLVVGQRIGLQNLLSAPEESRRRQILITFLSLLELAKMGFISLFQTDTYQEIYIDTKKEIEAEAISKVEEYDHLDEAVQVENKMDSATEIMELQQEEAIATDDEIFQAEKEILEGFV